MQDIGIQSGAVVDGKTIETVDARRLHGFLGSAKAFTTWMLERIEKYGFVDGVDFTTTTNLPNREVSSGGRQRTDYHVSLDMAKELAMVERTDKGREARKYFIECEKKLHEVAPGGRRIRRWLTTIKLLPRLLNYAVLVTLGASMPTSAIQLDTAYTYSLAATAALRQLLETTHGSEFADAFIKEHQNAIGRAVQLTLCGRDDAAVRQRIALLKRSYHT
ncbi:hypothetical protein HH213_07155 [Duganella dendranthematis]|uniref:AntA/AntB antirepressor domain-containing protein n=1 Tax=Duganella dendranthematis TaxID=2728021 RepID=A0ABX6M7D8_9BURK|nr:antA/AntB antirepressor family protein [Duganella dendranthematis]QJD89896.1 hypothetical protein HH213_07155 [Duganella dendranthematis]